MEVEIGNLTGAAYGEKSPDRLVQRNGHRERDWQTRAGTVELRLRDPPTFIQLQLEFRHCCGA